METNEPSPPDRSGPRIFSIRFFLLPALVALPFVLLVAFVAFLSQEETRPAALVETIRTGTPHARWQAAMHLALALQRGEAGGVVAEDLLSLWESDAGKDPQVRRYLLLAFSHTPDPRVREILSSAARSGPEEERLCAVWSLSLWRNAADFAALAKALADEAPAVRKMAVGGVAGLSSVDTEARRAALLPLLADPVADCRWNAALALAPMGETSAIPVFEEMLDRGRVAAAPGITPEQVEACLVQAVQAGRRFSALAPKIDALAREDPSLKVRSAARER